MNDAQCDGITIVDQDKINTIITQTTYTRQEAHDKMVEFDNDMMKVIEDFMGIPAAKPPKAETINQEIYRQIRGTLDKSMREYRIKNPIDINHVAANFAEEEDNVK